MNPPAPRTSVPRTSVATLRRLGPYVRPVRGRLLVAGAAALAATLAGLAIPLVIQAIVDGPVATGDRSRLVLLVGAVLALGVLEATLM